MTDSTGPLGSPASDAARAPRRGETPGWRAVLERATLREILMGAQDNLTNVMAVMLGVAIGAGRADLVALAGVSAAVAESVSMGGVLYSSTRAEAGHDRLERAVSPPSVPPRIGALSPARSGLVTGVAALLGGLVPLVPFIFLPLAAAVAAALTISVGALFALGSVTGRLSGQTWWRDGIRLVMVAGLAAVAAAIVGTVLHVS